MTQDLVPTAHYESPSEPKGYDFIPGDGPHSTIGETTKISDIVINAGGQDRDTPSEAKDTPLGQLRARLTTLQDKINIFLTNKMKEEKYSKELKELEKKMLDEGVDEGSSDNE